MKGTEAESQEGEESWDVKINDSMTKFQFSSFFFIFYFLNVRVWSVGVWFSERGVTLTCIPNSLPCRHNEKGFFCACA